MQPIGAVYMLAHSFRRKSNTYPTPFTSTHQHNYMQYLRVMKATKACSDENKPRSLSVSLPLSSSKSSNLDGETPTKAQNPELQTKTNITPNPLLTTDEAKKSPSDVSKRSSMSPNLSLKSSKSSNLGEESPTRAHNGELKPNRELKPNHEQKTKTNITDPNLLLTTDKARKACSDVSNQYGETPITDNKVTVRQTVCEGKADWIRKNLCCCFCRAEGLSQV